MCCRERMDEFFKRTNDGRGNGFGSTRNPGRAWKISKGETRIATFGKTTTRCCTPQPKLQRGSWRTICSKVTISVIYVSLSFLISHIDIFLIQRSCSKIYNYYFLSRYECTYMINHLKKKVGFLLCHKRVIL